MINITTVVELSGAILVAIATSILFSNRKNSNPKTVIKEFFILGTIIQLKVYGKMGEKAIDEAVML